MAAKAPAVERLLDGFEPSFEFEPVDPLPASEFAERDRRIRREAALAGCDALILHTDIIGWYHTSNSYLRYYCDWIREGALVVPTDADKAPVLLSFFSSSVLLPPPGEPVGVDDIRQVAPWGRETWDRPSALGTPSPSSPTRRGGWPTSSASPRPASG